MTKREFLADLAEKIDCLPPEDIGHWLDYYSEMIDDRIEDGMSEEQAVYAMGNVYDIATQIMIDTPIRTLVKTRTKPTHELAAWEIVLIVLGAVVWLPLLIAAIAVIFSIYAAMWAFIVSLYAVSAALGITGIAIIAIGGMSIPAGNISEGLPMLGGGLFLIGFTIIFTLIVNAAAKLAVRLSRAVWHGIKMLLIRKEHAA